MKGRRRGNKGVEGTPAPSPLGHLPPDSLRGHNEPPRLNLGCCAPPESVSAESHAGLRGFGRGLWHVGISSNLGAMAVPPSPERQTCPWRRPVPGCSILRPTGFCQEHTHLHVHTYTYMCVPHTHTNRMHTHMHTHLRVCTHIHTHTCAHHIHTAYAHINAHTYTPACMRTQTYICVPHTNTPHACAHTSIYTHLHSSVCTSTHTCMHMDLSVPNSPTARGHSGAVLGFVLRPIRAQALHTPAWV